MEKLIQSLILKQQEITLWLHAFLLIKVISTEWTCQ